MHYYVLLEANENPFDIQDKFDRSVIDLAFDESRSKIESLLKTNDKSDNKTIWILISLRIASYLFKIA